MLHLCGPIYSHAFESSTSGRKHLNWGQSYIVMTKMQNFSEGREITVVKQLPFSHEEKNQFRAKPDI